MLYHISIDAIKDNFLTPKIPSSKLPFENKTIPRICFSKTLEGAFTALPGNFKFLKGLIDVYDLYNIRIILHLYTIDEKNISKENIIKSKTLVSKKLVPDAFITNEVWVINEPIICNHQAILFNDFCFDLVKINNDECIYRIFNVNYTKATQNDIKKSDAYWKHISNIAKAHSSINISSDLKRELLILLSEKQ